MRISVVVPVLNEERTVARCLAELGDFDEVVVVDGGSTDATRERVRAFPSVSWLAAPRGRARQMNAGARAAQGEVLLFLHADVQLPEGACTRIREALADASTVAGAFKTWTVPEGVQRAWLAPLLHLADLRSRYSRLPYGDQAVFVRREDFEAVGGFPEQPLMEDLELALRLARRGRIAIVDARVTVSGRRFQARPLFYFTVVNVFPLLYWLGVSPSRLARLYSNVR